MGLIAIFITVLTAVLVGLKLANLIAWSWLWVLSPAWIPIGLIIVVSIIQGVRSVLDKFFED